MILEQCKEQAEASWGKKGELCFYARLGEARPCAVKDLPHLRQDLLVQENVAVALWLEDEESPSQMFHGHLPALWLAMDKDAAK